jgi:hypothetical protein
MSGYCYVGKSKIYCSDKKALPVLSVKHSPWYHFSVFINGTAFGVTGGDKQRVSMEDMSEAEYVEYNEILLKIALSATGSVSPTNLQQFVSEWLESHPRYGLLGDNCQLFAKDLAAKFFKGAVIVTQMDEFDILGRRMIAGIPTLFLSLLAVMILWIVVAFALHWYGMYRLAGKPHVA